MRTLVLSCVVYFFSLPVVADTLSLQAVTRCPYICDIKSDKKGILIDITNYIFTRAGHKVDYQTHPWARVVNAASKGSIDGIIGATRKNVPDLLFPQHALMLSKIEFFVRYDETWQYKGLASLFKKRIGVINNLSYGKMDSYIRKYTSNPRRILIISGKRTLSRSTNMLKAKRIGAILEDKMVMGYFLKQQNLQDRIKPAGGVSGENMYVAFSPLRPYAQKYTDLVSAALAKDDVKQKMKEILASYQLPTIH